MNTQCTQQEAFCSSVMPALSLPTLPVVDIAAATINLCFYPRKGLIRRLIVANLTYHLGYHVVAGKEVGFSTNLILADIVQTYQPTTGYDTRHMLYRKNWCIVYSRACRTYPVITDKTGSILLWAH